VAVFIYLRFRLGDTADIQDFEGDVRAMAELAQTQPGYVWSEMGLSIRDRSGLRRVVRVGRHR
jgi:hypothetical protein